MPFVIVTRHPQWLQHFARKTSCHPRWLDDFANTHELFFYNAAHTSLISQQHLPTNVRQHSRPQSLQFKPMQVTRKDNLVELLEQGAVVGTGDVVGFGVWMCWAEKTSGSRLEVHDTHILLSNLKRSGATYPYSTE
jgi:hypothetical protein